jgi:hypothetical protein
LQKRLPLIFGARFRGPPHALVSKFLKLFRGSHRHLHAGKFTNYLKRSAKNQEPRTLLVADFFRKFNAGGGLHFPSGA